MDGAHAVTLATLDKWARTLLPAAQRPATSFAKRRTLLEALDDVLDFLDSRELRARRWLAAEHNEYDVYAGEDAGELQRHEETLREAMAVLPSAVECRFANYLWQPHARLVLEGDWRARARAHGSFACFSGFGFTGVDPHTWEAVAEGPHLNVYGVPEWRFGVDRGFAHGADLSCASPRRHWRGGLTTIGGVFIPFAQSDADEQHGDFEAWLAFYRVHRWRGLRDELRRVPRSRRFTVGAAHSFLGYTCLLGEWEQYWSAGRWLTDPFDVG